MSRNVTGGSMTYTYDAGGTMVKRTNADGSATVYIGGIFEKNFNASGIATGTTKYYSALGRTLAVRTETGGGVGTLSYLLADHLGTTVGTLDASGSLTGTQKYWPYGATRSGSIAQTDKLYTGQQQELGDALGLYNYKARMYSTVTGRFVSADAIAKDGLNRYAYARNNPLRYNDPTGLDAASDLTGLAWAFSLFASWGGTYDEFLSALLGGDVLGPPAPGVQGPSVLDGLNEGSCNSDPANCQQPSGCPSCPNDASPGLAAGTTADVAIGVPGCALNTRCVTAILATASSPPIAIGIAASVALSFGFDDERGVLRASRDIPFKHNLRPKGAIVARGRFGDNVKKGDVFKPESLAGEHRDENYDQHRRGGDGKWYRRPVIVKDGDVKVKGNWQPAENPAK